MKVRGNEESQKSFHQRTPPYDVSASFLHAPLVALVHTSPFHTASGLCLKVSIPEAADSPAPVINTVFLEASARIDARVGRLFVPLTDRRRLKGGGFIAALGGRFDDIFEAAKGFKGTGSRSECLMQ